MEHWIAFWTALWVGSSRLTRWTVDWLCNATAKKKTPASQDPAAEGETGNQPETSPGDKPSKNAPAKKPAAEDAEGSALLRWVGLLIAAVVAKSTPYTTTLTLSLTAAWVLTSLVLGYIAAMPPKEKKAEGDGAAETPAAADEAPHPRDQLTLDHVAQLLADVYTEGSGVHLAALADHLITDPPEGVPRAPWSTADMRTLMGRHGVRVRPGVRVPPVGGREGVHREDFPPLPSAPSGETVVGVVVPGQSNNNNQSNAHPFTVRDDPENPARHTVHHTTQTG